MGLPKVKRWEGLNEEEENTEDLLTVKHWNSTFSRLKKKEFSLEEIYTNKNYKSPTNNRWRKNASNLLWRRSTSPRINLSLPTFLNLVPAGRWRQSSRSHVRRMERCSGLVTRGGGGSSCFLTSLSLGRERDRRVWWLGYGSWQCFQSCNLKADWISNTDTISASYLWFSGIGPPVASMPKKRVASRRCHGSNPVEDESDVDVMLVERLSALEDFLTQQGLDV